MKKKERGRNGNSCLPHFGALPHHQPGEPAFSHQLKSSEVRTAYEHCGFVSNTIQSSRHSNTFLRERGFLSCDKWGVYFRQVEEKIHK